MAKRIKSDSTGAPLPGLQDGELWRCLQPVARADMVQESSIREFAKRTIGEKLFAAMPTDTRAAEDGSGPITAVINTNDVDHYQTIVDPAGGKFENFLKNPIVLYQHGYDWQYGFWPVGQCQELRKFATSIEADTLFDLEAENKLGKELDRLYRKKWMRGWSIGFMPRSYDIILQDDIYYLKYLDWDLLEYSAVAVPGNQNALTKALKDGSLIVENAMLREYMEAITREQEGDKTTTVASVPELPGKSGGKKTGKGTKAAKPGRVEVPASDKLLELIGRRDGIKLELCVDDMDMDDETLNKVKSFMSGMMGNGGGGDGEGGETYKPEGVDGEQEKKADAALVKAARKFPVEWSLPFNLEGEARSASHEALPKMAAVVAGSGEQRRAMFLHHHADGKVNYRALMSAMTRLLTEPVDITDDEKAEAYKHLRSHYVACGVTPPEPTKMTADEAYDFALEQRGTWRQDGYDWVFVEPIIKEGRLLGAGFARIDDSTKMRVGPLPELGRLTDHRAWGKRVPGTRAMDDTSLAQIATLRRELTATLDALQSRKGAEFSKKNRDRISQAASQIDTTVADMQRAVGSLGDAATFLRSLIDTDDGADGDDTDDGGSRQAGGGGPDGGRSPANKPNQPNAVDDDGERRLK